MKYKKKKYNYGYGSVVSGTKDIAGKINRTIDGLAFNKCMITKIRGCK